MWRLFFLMLAALIPVQSAAQSETELARSARKLLSQPRLSAGFVEETRCYKVKPEGKKKKPVTQCVNELKSLDVLLAVRKDGDKHFTIVEAAGSGPSLCVSKTAGFETKCYVNHLGKTNGVNTEFEIERPAGYKVYAIRRVVNNPGGRKEAVYTPYSDKLNTPSIRRAGWEYVESVIEKALSDLRTRRVRSLIDPQKLVADMVDKDVIRRLVLIEHIDEYRFRKEDFSTLVKEVYATYGLNEGLAYNYAVSSAGARGMFQIIPKTYKSMRDTYPTAGLRENFVDGTRDHVNAAKAAMLLTDHDFSLVPKGMRSTVQMMFGDYTASSYNGGPSRPIRIIKAGGDLVGNNQNPENKLYVMKMRATEMVIKAPNLFTR